MLALAGTSKIPHSDNSLATASHPHSTVKQNSYQIHTMASRKQLSADAYTVGVIYVKPLEMHAITGMLDEEQGPGSLQLGDNNEYTLGRIGTHNIVIAGPARGAQGKVAIAEVVSEHDAGDRPPGEAGP